MHGFYCNIPLLSTENFQTVAQNELSASQNPRSISGVSLDFVENTQHQRRIHEGGRTSKRQGTKRRGKKGMSLLVAIGTPPRLVQGCKSGQKKLQLNKDLERNWTRAADVAGRACEVFRGLHRACARTRCRCHPDRCCEQRP